MEILQTQTHIGLIREKNEDVVSSVKHPRNKNIKLPWHQKPWELL